MTWFCAYTDPRCEWRVAGDLWAMGYETLTLYHLVMLEGMKKSFKVKRWFYPRYVFADLPDNDAVADLIYLRGVNHLLGTVRGPIHVPDMVIDRLKEMAGADGLVDMPEETVRLRVRAGTAVRIADGPLSGLFALVIQDLGDEIEAWVQAFGRDRVKTTLSPKALGLLPAA